MFLDRASVATQEHVEEAFRLFNVSTVDAARSGINEHLNFTPEIANEIKVERCPLFLSGRDCKCDPWLNDYFIFECSKLRHK